MDVDTREICNAPSRESGANDVAVTKAFA